MSQTVGPVRPIKEGETPEGPLPRPLTANRSTGEILATPPKYLSGLRIIVDAEELIAASMDRIMNATTPEELLANPDSAGLRDLTGDVIEVTNVTGIMPSTLRPGDYYLIFEAIIKPGAPPTTLTTGSPYAAGRIAKCYREGWLPRFMRVVQLESSTNPGQSSLWVVDAQPKSGEALDADNF